MPRQAGAPDGGSGRHAPPAFIGFRRGKGAVTNSDLRREQAFNSDLRREQAFNTQPFVANPPSPRLRRKSIQQRIGTKRQADAAGGTDWMVYFWREAA
jgi:hypothetical protein